MRLWLTGQTDQIVERQMDSQIVPKRWERPALRSDLDDRAIGKPLMPYQSGLPPVDDEAILKVVETSTLFEGVVEVPDLGPFGMRTARRNGRCVSRDALTHIVDANKTAIEALFAEEDDDLITSVEDWSRLVLLIGVQPTRGSESLQIQPTVSVADELDVLCIWHKTTSGKQLRKPNQPIPLLLTI
jgi:hypothetical protein